jgi:hypothetical protein
MVFDSPFGALLRGHVDEASEMRLDERCKFCFAHQIDPYGPYMVLYGPFKLWFEFKVFWDDLDDLEVFEFVVVNRQGETCSGVPPPEDLGGAVGTAFSRETDAVNAIDSA